MDHGELAYYRAVEDHFARLRGTSFLFTPKDFGLLRQWWAEGVPLAAVLAGIGEAMTKRSERGEDPVSSLAYCRHAVVRHVKRLAAAAAGTAGQVATVDVPAVLAAYAAAARAAAVRWSAEEAVAGALAALADAVETLPADAPAAALEATASSLEATALEAAAAALPTGRKVALDGHVAAAVAAATNGEPIAATARRALVVKTLRGLFGLPRLELWDDAPQG